jgi:hypothetical protein
MAPGGGGSRRALGGWDRCILAGRSRLFHAEFCGRGSNRPSVCLGGLRRAALRTSSPGVKPAIFGIRAKVMDEGASTDDEAPGFLPRFGETPEDKSSAPEHPRSTTSQGSGFFISSDGYAVTTNHVIEHGASITIETDDGNTYPARLVASDPHCAAQGRWWPWIQVGRNRRPGAVHRGVGDRGGQPVRAWRYRDGRDCFGPVARHHAGQLQ